MAKTNPLAAMEQTLAKPNAKPKAMGKKKPKTMAQMAGKSY